MMSTLLRLILFRGWRAPGALTGIRFPCCLKELTPELLTEMLRHGGHMPVGMRVSDVIDDAISITDGVKGDKGTIRVAYASDGSALSACITPPSRFFVKFNIRKLSAMRLLIETSECARCESLFYSKLSGRCPIPTPKAYFVDYHPVTGESCLLTEVVEFGSKGVRPLKHRIRDAASLDEQRAFVRAGAALNAAYWADAADTLLAELPRYDLTHRRMWKLAQATARLGGLHHTTRGLLKGQPIRNAAFVTWRAPAELLGRESELIRDMPALMSSLCEDMRLVAYGHNDLVTDNAYYHDDGVGEPLRFGVFDWQQGCYNSVGQEWAWNWHWLEPEFLEAHEAELIDLLLDTYRRHGRVIAREQFLNAYTLGCAQMFVWGGGGLQLLMADLRRRGLLDTLKPNDERLRSSSTGVDDATAREKLLGAEMTRRTFTNVCGIMRRHDFVGRWERWREGTR